MKILLTLPIIILLSGCSTAFSKVDQIESIVRPQIEETVDRLNNRGHRFICNSTYRGEQAFKESHNINTETFRSFCGRDVGTDR